MTVNLFRTRLSSAATRALCGLLVSALALSPMGGSAGLADDTDLFRASVPPNIMFVVDNSKSMNNSVTHPGYEMLLPDGSLGKNQSDCQVFRNLPGDRFQIWNPGKYVAIVDKNGNKIKGATSDQGYGAIWDRNDPTVQAIKNPNAASNPGAPLFYKVVSTDQGGGQAFYYDTGDPIMDKDDPTQPMYWGSGANAKLETRITPREAALDSGIDIMNFEFTPGTTLCGVTIPASPTYSLWPGDPSFEVPSGSTMFIRYQYLDYLFSPVGAEARAAVFEPSFANDGRRYYSPCLALTGGDNEYDVYRRSRLMALQKILETVVCEVNQAGTARFGIAQFRFRGGGGLGGAGDGNVQGGYAVLPIDDFKVWSEADNAFVANEYDLHGYAGKSHAEHLRRVISKVGPDSTTPLAETLFQVYTYFMSRTAEDLPYGRNPDGTSTGVRFPVYSYDTSQPDDSDPKDLDIVGGHFLPTQANGDANAAAPPSPVQYPCQKNFVLFITDGGSFEDVFNLDPTQQPMTVPVDTGKGFDDFLDLIGDHYRDVDGSADEVEWNGSGKNVLYMDDIAYFMNRWDFMPNEDLFPGDQTIDTYTVGYALEAGGDSNLEKAARNGNGLYFESADSDQLAADLVEAIADMIEKAQSFTSATVPSSRTADGNNFYSSYFRPDQEIPFWEGHLRAFDFTVGGDILTPAGNCAVGTDVAATPPCSTNGELRIGAPPYWDAADMMPVPASRKLYVGLGKTSFLSRAALWNTMDEDDLMLEPEDLLAEPYPLAITDELRIAINGLDPGDDIGSLVDEASDSLGALATMIVKNVAGCRFGTDCVVRADDTGAVRTLGDIYHSNPIIVGSPNSPINEPSYKTFAKTYLGRERILYAGSNDGWLHAFNAGSWRTHDPVSGDELAIPRHDRGTGVEEFGFMPSYVRTTIHDLRPRNGFPRNWYGVDGSPIAADVWMYRNLPGDGAVEPLLPTVDAPKTAAQWRTVVMGGLRGGGEGYYAIDVTNPADATNFPGYLWDFPCEPEHCDEAVNHDSEAEADYVAATWSEPVITRVRVKGNVDDYAGKGYERWVAIFGAGYHVKGDPNLPGYESDVDAEGAKYGRAIYILDITTGEVLAKKHWSKEAVSISGAQIGFPEMRYAIPSAPAVYDLDFDGFADVVYIGDLGGNLWKWVIHDLGDDPINNDSFNDNVAQPNWPFSIHFRAPAKAEPALGDPPDFTLTTNHYRSIFFPPTGVLRGKTLVLAFGTGERANIKLWDADDLTSNNNRYYVVKDVDPFARGTMPDPLLGYLDEGDLATNAQIESLTCAEINGSHYGFTVMARDAEKFVTNSAIFLGDVITGSYIPPDPTNANPCDASGEAFLYRFSVDCAVGAYPDPSSSENDERRKSIGKGMPTRPRVSAGSITDATNADDPCANRVVVVTSDGSVDNECQGTSGSSGIGVRSWLQR